MDPAWGHNSARHWVLAQADLDAWTRFGRAAQQQDHWIEMNMPLYLYIYIYMPPMRVSTTFHSPCSSNRYAWLLHNRSYVSVVPHHIAVKFPSSAGLECFYRLPRAGAFVFSYFLFFVFSFFVFPQQVSSVFVFVFVFLISAWRCNNVFNGGSCIERYCCTCDALPLNNYGCICKAPSHWKRQKKL